MTATYTFDVFGSLDGNATYGPPGDWGGYWGKQGPEFLDHRRAAYTGEQRMLFGANTFRAFLEMLPTMGEDERDPWIDEMLGCPTTVISSTLPGPFDWPDATVVGGDAVQVVPRLKDESDVPIRSHGSLSLNRALMAAGLVDRIQLAVFPVRRPHPGAGLPAHPAYLAGRLSEAATIRCVVGRRGRARRGDWCRAGRLAQDRRK